MLGEKERKKIIKYLKKHIKARRFEHTMGTAECAVKMAKVYGVDEKKAQIAALLHDCAKEQDDKIVIKNALEFGFKLDEMYEREPQLLHGAAGARIAKKKFEIEDEEILEAICYHTVPKPKMCDLAKIIYVADKIERTREFNDIKAIRDEIGKESLDHVFLSTLKRVKLSHILRNRPLHPSSLETYNHLIMKL